MLNFVYICIQFRYKQGIESEAFMQMLIFWVLLFAFFPTVATAALIGIVVLFFLVCGGWLK